MHSNTKKYHAYMVLFIYAIKIKPVNPTSPLTVFVPVMIA